LQSKIPSAVIYIYINLSKVITLENFRKTIASKNEIYIIVNSVRELFRFIINYSGEPINGQILD